MKVSSTLTPTNSKQTQAHGSKAEKKSANEGLEALSHAQGKKVEVFQADLEKKDAAVLSEKAQQFHSIKSAAQKTPSVREDKVAQLKERIEKNQYHVPSEAIADRLVQEHLDFEQL